LLGSIAQAQTPEASRPSPSPDGAWKGDPRGECTTTTTVTTTTKCTGDAAPLAVPQPPAPPVEVEPPPPPPPLPAPPPPACCCDSQRAPLFIEPLKLGSWTLVRDPDGRYFKERVRRKPSGATIAGLTIFGLSSFGLLIGGPVSGHPEAAVPFFGPAASAAIDSHMGAKIGFGIMSGIQLTSLVVALVGIGLGERYTERVPVTFQPYLASTGGGAALSGRF
jgi:hypothetical protein